MSRGGALGAHRPLTVVVSTPTDTVSTLAGRYRDRVAFVHLEVRADFENRINPADGVIAHRFDNVASETALDAAIQEVLA